MTKRLFGSALVCACALVALLVGSVQAKDGVSTPGRYQANIKPIQTNIATNSSGKVHLEMDQSTLEVRVHMTGLAPNTAYTQQIRGMFPNSGAKCPTMENDANRDSFIDAVELATSTGDVVLPLNGSADNIIGKQVTAVSDDKGEYRYTVKVPVSYMDSLLTRCNLAQGVICVFGVAEGNSLPDTVALYESNSAQASLPIGCGSIYTVD